jgi:hypothetical protein
LLGTLVNGQWLIKKQNHLKQEEIQNSFVKSMNQIKIR